MKIKNTSPLGDIVIPALGLTVKAGAVFDVADDTVGADLLAQGFAPADKAAAAAVPTTTEETEESE